MALITPIEFAEALNIKPKTFAALRRRDPAFPEPIRLTSRILRWQADAVASYINSKTGEENESKSEDVGSG